MCVCGQGPLLWIRKLKNWINPIYYCLWSSLLIWLMHIYIYMGSFVGKEGSFVGIQDSFLGIYLDSSNLLLPVIIV